METSCSFDSFCLGEAEESLSTSGQIAAVLALVQVNPIFFFFFFCIRNGWSLVMIQGGRGDIEICLSERTQAGLILLLYHPFFLYLTCLESLLPENPSAGVELRGKAVKHLGTLTIDQPPKPPTPLVGAVRGLSVGFCFSLNVFCCCCCCAIWGAQSHFGFEWDASWLSGSFGAHWPGYIWKNLWHQESLRQPWANHGLRQTLSLSRQLASRAEEAAFLLGPTGLLTDPWQGTWHFQTMVVPKATGFLGFSMKTFAFDPRNFFSSYC